MFDIDEGYNLYLGGYNKLISCTGWLFVQSRIA
jgi:hypothetical protein